MNEFTSALSLNVKPCLLKIFSTPSLQERLKLTGIDNFGLQYSTLFNVFCKLVTNLVKLFSLDVDSLLLFAVCGYRAFLSKSAL